MEIKEAIKTLDAVIPPPDHKTVDLDHLPIAQAWQTVKKTIEKQTPKALKVVPVTEWLSDYYCPKCGHAIISKESGGWFAGKKQKYCDECGQALDWEERGEKTC